MNKYKVTGADKESGKDVKMFISAKTPQKAAAKAKGMYVSSVENLDEDPSVLSKINGVLNTPIIKPIPLDISEKDLFFRLLSLLLIICGLVIFWYYVSEYSATAYSPSSSNVHNIGLMQNRLIGCISGLFAMATGIVTIAISYVAKDS